MAFVVRGLPELVVGLMSRKTLFRLLLALRPPMSLRILFPSMSSFVVLVGREDNGGT